ncbi:MAG: hypothetical protein AAFX99_24070, partial [Myxococcota bacterium]
MTAVWMGLLCWGVFGLVVGCSQEPDSSQECSQDGDCLLGQVCLEGRCSDGCRDEGCSCEQDNDCGFRLSCVDNACQPSSELVCGSSADEGADACPSGQRDSYGICAPMEPTPPMMTSPEGCPAGMSPEGVCLPVTPALPRWFCPDGWENVQLFSSAEQFGDHWPDTLAIPTACRPPELPRSCPPGMMPVVGESGCVRMGPECPSDGSLWPNEAALRARAAEYEGRVWYVSPDGLPEGDGTPQNPLGSVAVAVAQAVAGDVIALGVGTFMETVVLDKNVALVGACVEGTLLTAPDPGSEAILRVARGSAARRWVSDLTLTGARPGLSVDRVSGVQVHAVHIRGASGVGVLAGSFSGLPLVLEDVLITDTVQTQLSGGFEGGGAGAFLSQGVVQANRLTLIGNSLGGIIVTGGFSDVRLADVAIVDTMLNPALGVGGGIAVQSGSTVTLERG